MQKNEWQVYSNKRPGFTIVELLVVIVVIGILAAITVVSYSGISNQAIVASIKSDLNNSAKIIKVFQVEQGSYPISVSTNCNASPDTTTNKCLKLSQNNEIELYEGSRTTFRLIIKNGSNYWSITEDSAPIASTSQWVTIGSRSWARFNHNFGVMLGSGIENPSNNGVVEKWCYNNLEANCKLYGAMYSWDEAMQYVNTPAAKGICPTGSHIPTDAEWTNLVNTTIDPTIELPVGGSSGFDIIISPMRNSGGTFGDPTDSASFWSSNESTTLIAWGRILETSVPSFSRNTFSKTNGFSVRCVKD